MYITCMCIAHCMCTGLALARAVPNNIVRIKLKLHADSYVQQVPNILLSNEHSHRTAGTYIALNKAHEPNLLRSCNTKTVNGDTACNLGQKLT